MRFTEERIFLPKLTMKNKIFVDVAIYFYLVAIGYEFENLYVL